MNVWEVVADSHNFKCLSHDFYPTQSPQQKQLLRSCLKEIVISEVNVMCYSFFLYRIASASHRERPGEEYVQSCRLCDILYYVYGGCWKNFIFVLF